MTERATCETCRWWGKPTDPPPIVHEYRQCHWPVPIWLDRRWASPADLSGCQTHQPRKVADGLKIGSPT